MLAKAALRAVCALSLSIGVLPGLAAAQPSSNSEPQTKDVEVRSEWQMFAIILKPGPNWKSGQDFSQQGLGPHFLYLKQLVDEGVIFVAGPMGNDRGLILLYAKNQEAADTILDNDPAVLQGTFVGEALPYVVRLLGEGSLPVSRK